MKISGCKPAGTSILVRHLSPQESYGTSIHISGSAKTDVPQGIILAFGPALENLDKYGFKVGDRVIFNGKGTMVPSWDDNEYGLVDPNIIKGIVVLDETV